MLNGACSSFRDNEYEPRKVNSWRTCIDLRGLTEIRRNGTRVIYARNNIWQLTCCFCRAATSPQTGPNPVSSVSFLITHSMSSRNDSSKAFQCSVLLSKRFLRRKNTRTILLFHVLFYIRCRNIHIFYRISSIAIPHVFYFVLSNISTSTCKILLNIEILICQLYTLDF